MKKIIICLSLCCAMYTFAQEKVCLSKDTRISVIIKEEINSQKVSNPLVEVSSDVYDESGKMLIIKKGTPVLVQIKFRKANLEGDVGKIEVTPVATTSVNGRDISFKEVPVVFEGNESILRSRMKAKVAANTGFSAIIANTYCF